MSNLLDQRIVEAFTAAAKASDIADLIKEVEVALIYSQNWLRTVTSEAFDPSLSETEVSTARSAMGDAAFRHERYQEAIRRLSDRHREVKVKEEQERRRAAYELAAKERDSLANELAALYPNLAAQLTDLMARVKDNDQCIERINSRALPAGKSPLQGSELKARGLQDFREGVNNVPRITEELRLPAFKYVGRNPYSWP